MRETKTRTVAEQKPLGVIDVISAGIGLVWRRPWTLLVPLLFDSLIWLLPRLSLAQLLRPFTNAMLTVTPLGSDPQAIEETRRTMQQLIDSFHLLGLVATALNAVTRLPTLLAVDAAEVHSPVNAWAATFQFNSPALVVLLFVPIFLLGLGAVAFYLEWIAQGARPLEAATSGASLVRVARLWLRLMLFSLLLVGFLLAAGVVVAFMQLVFNSPELAGFATLMITVGLFWIFIYFFFVPSALAMSDIGVREGLKRSTLLFRAFFWSTIALVGLSVFLDFGLRIIWDGLTVSSLGVLLGMVANAFIGTALIAASMVYYQDRMTVFERMRAHAKAKSK